jgi:hypothetical protein
MLFGKGEGPFCQGRLSNCSANIQDHTISRGFSRTRGLTRTRKRRVSMSGEVRIAWFSTRTAIQTAYIHRRIFEYEDDVVAASPAVRPSDFHSAFRNPRSPSFLPVIVFKSFGSDHAALR